ncbi:MAG: glutamate racemase [Zoogloeaceae bacterium]|nr:glutamate racemase [Zoogloeaceae bacterium]
MLSETFSASLPFPSVCKDGPIGIFDSGLGGLTVLAALRARLPMEDCLYFADTRFLPYGNRSEAFILSRSRAITAALAERGAKLIVIACNTATAAAAEAVRASTHLPVVALEPAVKPAVALTRSGVVGVLATTRTLASERFQKLVRAHAHGVRILPQPCPGLAEAIEAEGPESPGVNALLDLYVPPLAEARADVVVLGCTHYPWVKAGIAARLPADTRLVDTGEAVARQVARRLPEASHPHPDEGNTSGQLRIATSGAPEAVRRAVGSLHGTCPPVEFWDF